MAEKTPLDKSVEDLNRWKEDINKSAEEAEDVKEGRCTAEEERKEPAYVLYNQIAESSIHILQLPEIVSTFAMISETVGEKTGKALVELMAIAMSQSAYQAICFYDELLKEELSKQFNHVGEHLNIARADIDAHTSALSVFRKQLNDIQNKMKIDTFTKENNVTQPK